MSNDTNNSSHSGKKEHHSHSHHSHSSYSQPYGYGSSAKRKWTRKPNKEAQKYNKKKRRSMKKNNKIKLIIAIIICIIIIVAIAAYEIYDSFILPNYVKPVLEEVVTVMHDDKYTDKITQEIRRLYDLGQISGTEVEQYLEQHENSDDTDSSPDTANAASDNTANNRGTSNSTSSGTSSGTSDSTSVNNTTSTSALGQNIVNVKDENSDTQGKHYSLDSSDSNSAAASQAEKINPSSMSYDSLIAKAKSAMSAEDFATAMNIKSKISLSKVKELRSDSSALLQYVQNTLTPDEYSTALSLYVKYANILN